MSFERENIRRLDPYVPGEQPGYEDADRVVKLNTNENPYPPCDAVLDAIRTVPAEALRRYPPAEARRFRETAAKVHGLSPEQVIATNGGDELLRMAVTVFCEPTPGNQKPPSGRGGIGMTTPSYSLYSVLAQIQDTPVHTFEHGDDFALPGRFADRLNDAGCTLAFIVNPHAPSGRYEPPEVLADIARSFKGLLVIDEAYVDFAPGDAIDLVRADGMALDNVLILRSLSKGYSLAGLRFGYGLASASVIAALDKARDSYNTDIVSQLAAVAALEHRDQAAETWKAVRRDRDVLADELRRRGYTVPDSHSNFLLATPPPPERGPDARAIYETLKQKGILIRFFDSDRLNDKLRITVGTPQQNRDLINAIDQIRDQGSGIRDQ